MVQDLGRLPESTAKLLHLGALFGAKFDIRDVAHVSSMRVEQAESDLWIALHEGINFFLIGSNLCPFS